MGAIGDAYASPEDLALHLGREDNGTFTALLDAASRRVEQFAGRQFNQTDTASERRFRPTSPRTLPVDDFWTLDDLVVEVDGTAWDATDFEAYPYDGVHHGAPGWPYWVLYGTTRSWSLSRRAVITVTAKWGWPEVPEAIKLATVQCAAVASYGDGGAYPVRQVSIQDYSESYALPESSGDVPAELAAVLPYKRKRWGIA